MLKNINRRKFKKRIQLQKKYEVLLRHCTFSLKGNNGILI